MTVLLAILLALGVPFAQIQTPTLRITCCCPDPVSCKCPKLACGADAAACVTYLGANLTSSATPADVTAACTEYEIQKGR